MFDIFREIRQTLHSNKLRTILTGISVAWGVFMLIVLLGAAKGVTNSFRDNLWANTSNSMQVWSSWTSKPFHGLPAQRRIQLKDRDGDVIQKNDREHIQRVVSEGSIDTAKVIGPRGTLSGINAVYPAHFENRTPKSVTGRLINDRDMTEGRRVMIISAKNALRLFDNVSDAVGSSVEAIGLSWTIVGVYEHDWENSTFIPFSTYKSITGNNDDANSLTVNVQNITNREDAQAAATGVREALARQHEFDPTDDNAVWLWNQFDNYLETLQMANLLNLAVWIIGLLTLLTGIVGVSNIMFVSVRERTHEIGIRRAIGAKPRSILMQVLAESVTITTSFGYLGVVAGIAVLQLIDIIFGEQDGFKNPTVDINIALEVMIALIVAGALAGYFPAIKAIKVKPVEALRDE